MRSFSHDPYETISVLSSQVRPTVVEEYTRVGILILATLL